jgi:hypothetical protein
MRKEADDMILLPILVILAGICILMLLGGCAGQRFDKYQHPLCDHNRSACR